MRSSCRMTLAVLLTGILIRPTQAQPLQYRVSLAEEGTHYTLNNSTPFNFNNSILPQPRWGNVATANIFLASGVFSTSIGVTTTTDDLQSPQYNSAIHELALDIPLGDTYDLLLGKKILKWGTGYAFNPTGVIEPQRSPSDPTDRLDQNDGRNLASLTAFVGKSSLTIVYLNDAEFAHSALHWGDNEIALRAYTFLEGFDITLVGHYREGQRLEIGANSSYVIGENLELHGDILGKKGSSALYHPIITSDDPDQFYGSYPYQPLFADSREIYSKILLGGQFTFDSGINLALEYYHNGEGLNLQQWQRWMNFVRFQDAIQRGTIVVPPGLVTSSRINLLWSLLTLSPRGAMRDYLFARIAHTIDSWGGETLCFMNAEDRSLVIIPTITYKPIASLSVYVRCAFYAGRDGSEFGSLFTANALTLGLGVQI